MAGFRPGELTVLTGPTGLGKTTFLGSYSLDLAQQGVGTLWGSFEMNNVRLAKMLLTQFSRVNLSNHLRELPQIERGFSQLPLKFMNFHGAQSFTEVKTTMQHAVDLMNVQHIILDNMQFMIGCLEDNNSDRFYRQDRLIEELRKFATQSKCHVTMVIHPRKENPADLLSVASVYGGGKATQEADNVFIIQEEVLRRGDENIVNIYLQIAKNRFNGRRGYLLMRFNEENLLHSLDLLT